MPLTLVGADDPYDSERSLAEIGLSTLLIHDGLRRAVSNALSRTGFANPGAASTDIYHDGSEDLRAQLSRRGWLLGAVNNQVRIVHPQGLLGIVIASADNVGIFGDPKKLPVTRPKGPATTRSIRATQDARGQSFFHLDGVPDPEPVDPDQLAAAAPLWFLIHRLSGRSLLLELAEPTGYRPNGRVDSWGRRIPITPLTLDDDLDETFPESGPDDLDIPIPRR